MTADDVALDGFFVGAGTGRTGPAVAACGLCDERGLNAAHVEVTFAAIATNAFGSGRVWR